MPPALDETAEGSHREPSEADRVLAIEARGLTKRFGPVSAVKDLDLEIPPGTVYGFLGPNGSGKTTTMRMLTTLTRPTAGEARIAGTDIRDRNALIEGIGYLPEEPPLFDELTAREQLRHMAALHDMPAADAADRIEAYFERFGLEDAAGRRLEGFSTGMRKKVGLVQAVLHEPPVIFLDEPTSGLDPRAARTVKDLIADLTDHETTVFLSTHILSVVDELADTVGVLHNGRLVAEGPPAALKRRAERGRESTLEDVFLSVTADHDAELTDDNEDGIPASDGGVDIDIAPRDGTDRKESGGGASESEAGR